MRRLGTAICLGWFLLILSCAEPYEVLFLGYQVGELAITEINDTLHDMLTLVVQTEDPNEPERTLYLNETTAKEVEASLRHPDTHTMASSGYTCWDYCYSQGKKISLRAPPQVRKCKALRLHFDPNNRLYAYDEDVDTNIGP